MFISMGGPEIHSSRYYREGKASCLIKFIARYNEKYYSYQPIYTKKHFLRHQLLNILKKYSINDFNENKDQY